MILNSNKIDFNRLYSELDRVGRLAEEQNRLAKEMHLCIGQMWNPINEQTKIVDDLVAAYKMECKRIKLIPDIIPAPHVRCVIVKHKFK